MTRAEITKLALAQLYRHTRLAHEQPAKTQELSALKRIEEDAFDLGTLLEMSTHPRGD